MSTLVATPRTLDYVAGVASRMLTAADQVIADLNEAIATGAPVLAHDPAIVDDTAASNRLSVLHFLHAVAARPDRPVTVTASAELEQKARNLIGRRIDLDVVLQAYRFGQQALWRWWMDTAAELVEHDPTELASVLRHGADLLFEYTNACLALEVRQIQEQQEERAQPGAPRRAEAIRLLLDAAPLDDAVASQRLGYSVAGPHTCLVLWGDRSIDDAALESAAGHLASRLGLGWASLRAGTGQLWVWLAGHVDNRDDIRTAHAELATSVRILVGPGDRGTDGFRRTHHRAVAVQRFAMHEGAGPIVWSDELRPVALCADDPVKVREFVGDTLGPLAAADPGLEDLRTTLLVFLEEGESAPRAAERLFAHRNTVLQRVNKATSLIGAPLAQRRLQVFLALELARRLGSEVLTPTDG